MGDLLELSKVVGLPTALLLIALVALWRERVAERAKLLENMQAQLKAAEAENGQLFADLKALQLELSETRKEQLRDAERFLAALEKKRAPSSPP